MKNIDFSCPCSRLPNKMAADDATWHRRTGIYFAFEGLLLESRFIPGGLLGYKRDGGVRRIFLGLKFSTPVIFWVEDLTVYFLGLKNLRVFFWIRISARLIVLTQ